MGKFELNRSLLFRLLSEEKKEIDRLKWIESEKCGHDIGINKATFIWLIMHQKQWRIEFLKKEKND